MVFSSDKIVRLVIALTALMAIPPVWADLADSYIELKANIVANACTVTTDSQTKYVELGTTAIKDLVSHGGVSSPVRFEIHLEDCREAASGVRVTFAGTPDGSDGALLALSSTSSAQNIAIAILDATQNLVPLAQSSVMYPLTPGPGIQVLTFYAQYRMTAQAVGPGSANAQATFVLEYD
ncbi:fimbrial protein [Entomohabitans teleogrylli]|uniref:fimbrial protein n=1 Tax=Entomohabitans teleogrylli TaxID=1384589 RepID=UPI00073D6CCD|nr:fimbrial protein [Entomohabitans teleogrylli]